MEKLEEELSGQPAVLLYFYSTTCGVCHSLRPKLERLLQSKFPAVKASYLDASLNQELAAQLRMLSVPGIIFFMEGKEVFRANGLIALAEIEAKISRPYNLYFG
jgi:thioredoxin 1